MSANIIRNSLNELRRPENPQTSSEYQMAGTSDSPDSVSGQQAVVGNNSNGSDRSNSTVSSNIDFNFDAYQVSESSNDEFPVSTLQPTTVRLLETPAGMGSGPSSRRTSNKSSSEASEQLSTRL